jgi:hypothetical protein
VLADGRAGWGRGAAARRLRSLLATFFCFRQKRLLRAFLRAHTGTWRTTAASSRQSPARCSGVGTRRDRRGKMPRRSRRRGSSATPRAQHKKRRVRESGSAAQRRSWAPLRWRRNADHRGNQEALNCLQGARSACQEGFRQAVSTEEGGTYAIIANQRPSGFCTLARSALSGNPQPAQMDQTRTPDQSADEGWNWH